MQKISIDLTPAKEDLKNVGKLLHGTHPVLIEISQERGTFRYIMFPLFEKLQRSALAYWLIFFAFSLGVTGVITHYINSYAQESERYAAVLNSLEGRNRVAFADMLDEATTTSSEKINHPKR